MKPVFGVCPDCQERTFDTFCPACYQSQHLKMRLFVKRLVSGGLEDELRRKTFLGQPEPTELLRQLELLRFLGENI